MICWGEIFICPLESEILQHMLFLLIAPGMLWKCQYFLVVISDHTEEFSVSDKIYTLVWKRSITDSVTGVEEKLGTLLRGMLIYALQCRKIAVNIADQCDAVKWCDLILEDFPDEHLLCCRCSRFLRISRFL